MQSYKWERPVLPDAHRGVGLLTGWALIICGVFTGLIGLSAVGDPQADFNGAIVTALGLSAASLGLIMVPACMIMREIRQSAFEAALRAGEVDITETQPSDAYEKFMERERAAATRD